MNAREWWMIGILLAMGGVIVAGSAVAPQRGWYGSAAALAYGLLFLSLLFVRFRERNKRK